MAIASIDSTFKLNQNREEAARRNVATELAKGGTPGLETQAVARMMREADSG